MSMKEFHMYLDDPTREKLEKLAQAESERNGYRVDLSKLVRRAIKEMMDRESAPQAGNVFLRDGAPVAVVMSDGSVVTPKDGETWKK